MTLCGVIRVAVLALALSGQASAQEISPEPIGVSTTPIERFDLRTPVGAPYGKLIFLGGLQLRSSDRDFGGLSGLRLSADGTVFTAISDRGNWFRGALTYENGRLSGLTDVVRAAIPGRDGRPLPGRRGFDTESLEIDGKTAWVSSERANWLTRYALGPDGFPSGPGVAVPLPKSARDAPLNSGFEAIAAMKGGGLAIVCEKCAGDDGDDPGYVVGVAKPFSFAVKRTENFSPTDMARLPDGDFVLLERRFVPPFSLAVRIRRLPGDAIRAGALVDGPVLMEATLSQQIDNFEGLSVHLTAEGLTVLTVVSDDNFSGLQRTLLMQFALGADAGR